MGRRQGDPSSIGNSRSLSILLLTAFISCCLAYMAFSSALKNPSRDVEIQNNVGGGGVGSSSIAIGIETKKEGEDEEECCRGMENLELWGSAVKWGTDHKFNSSVACCRACKAMCGGQDGPCLCDSWVFCGDRLRCGQKFGEALDLKKLQTPLYEEFFSTSNVPPTSPGLRNICKENLVNSTKPPLKSKRSPTKVLGGISAAAHADNIMSPGSYSKRISCDEIENSRVLKEIQSPRHNEWGELLQEAREEPYNSPNFSERQRKWKEELDQELGIKIIRQAAVIGAPKSRRRDCWRFISPGK